MMKRLTVLDKVFVGILLVIFGGIVVHAPLSVGLSTLFPHDTLIIKSWKEILLGVALVLAVVLLTTKKQWNIVRTKIIYCIAAFAALSVVLIPLFYGGFQQTIAGLFIDLRFLLFFVLVYVALKLYPQLFKLFFMTFIAGTVLVMVFAVLQVTVLPHDILKYLGYGKTTIMPFLTVDENINYIRINSTLRGPNPLGAYAVITAAIALAAWLGIPKKLKRWKLAVVVILSVGSVVALWASYSRSAALAAIFAVAAVLAVMYGRRLSKWVWVGLAALALIVGGSLVAFRDTQFVSQVIMHEDPKQGNSMNSNDGHALSLSDGAARMVREPLGTGIGSTGSASLMGDKPVIVENQYLFVAHETGWLGLGLFIVITYLVLAELWRRRTQWVALGVFASGIGLALVGLVLPVWVDDTVSIIWWGLAAMVVAMPIVKPATKKGRKV